MNRFAALALISTLATGAFAHSRVDTTTPENGATIAEVPSEINLNFSDDIRLTKVNVIHQDVHIVPLDLGGQTSFDRTFAFPLQSMGEGTYRIEWRGLGADGHAMQGEFMFTVN
ncbi:copper resistance CopC family protein [uncultured Ruegeria sp.]|uniref:copper resistance CopC family protein n=1 Tax=uncultured Ruegeria sp. TaxID=259304 RepID=UPI00262F3229|nr:copper resistance CopC family protein [uncultured Ruegeria sp.]